jgi:hypothetical protein
MQLDDICGALKDLQVLRKFVIATEIKNVNSMNALAARMAGYEAHDEDNREKLWTRGEGIVRRALAGKPPAEGDAEIVAVLDADLGMMRLALEPIRARRNEIEKEMCRLAKLLPVQGFVAATPGFSLIGLAVIIGESGNLANYATIAKLWRRLGYGMAKGHETKAYSTWRKSGGLSAEDWTTAGYSPRRLGQIYGVVTVPLMMFKAKNSYGAIYDHRRARTLETHPEWYADKNGEMKLTKDGAPRSAHAKMDAERIATKAFIRALWAEWRRAIDVVSERTGSRLPAVSSWSTPSVVEVQKSA